MIKCDVIGSNPYFRQYSTYRNSHNSILPTNVYNRNTRVINHLQRKNHTAVIAYKLFPANSNFQNIQILLVCVI